MSARYRLKQNIPRHGYSGELARNTGMQDPALVVKPKSELWSQIPPLTQDIQPVAPVSSCRELEELALGNMVLDLSGIESLRISDNPAAAVVLDALERITAARADVQLQQ
jgi:hypothetical protein